MVEAAERGYIGVGKGFDRLDCPALGPAFSRGPPTAACSESFDGHRQGSSEPQRTI